MATDMSSQKPAEMPTKTSPGSMLKRAREKAGVSLEHISDQTLIPVARLTALEKEDFDKVGGSAYVVGYARNAAQAIGVDPKPIVDAYTEILKKIDNSHQLAVELNLESIKASKPKKRLKALILGVGLALVVVVLLLVFLLISGGDRSGTESAVSPSTAGQASTLQSNQSSVDSEESVIDSVPHDLEVAQKQEPTSESETSVIGDEVDLEAIPDDIVDTIVEQSRVELPETESATDLSQDAFSSNDLEESYTVSEPQVESKLDLFFTDECWVKVTDATGKRLVARVANTGDHISVAGLTPFDVMLGNARGSSIELNSELVSFTPKKGKRTLRLSVGN